MPSLVHEVGVAGDGVDLATDFLELGVVLGQVFKLGGAHEGEVGRVEEEQGPVAEHIVLGHFVELIVLECVHLEIGQFMLQKSHHRSFRELLIFKRLPPPIVMW